MSDTRLLSDEELREYAGGLGYSGSLHSIATELIARRATESEVPFAVGMEFAVGDDVHTDDPDATVRTVIAIDESSDQRWTWTRYYTFDENPVYKAFPAAALTPVPPAPTAVEVFAEILRNAGIVNPRGLARRICEAADLSADKPLGGDAE